MVTGPARREPPHGPPGSTRPPSMAAARRSSHWSRPRWPRRPGGLPRDRPRRRRTAARRAVQRRDDLRDDGDRQRRRLRRRTARRRRGLRSPPTARSCCAARCCCGRTATAPTRFVTGGSPTGDVGRWLDDGRLHVDGRRGDLIITGGENVWPEPSNGCCAGSGSIADVAVAGDPDPEWGEAVTAYVVPAGRPPTPRRTARRREGRAPRLLRPPPARCSSTRSPAPRSARSPRRLRRIPSDRTPAPPSMT